MPVHFSSYISYDWDFNKARHLDGHHSRNDITLGLFRVDLWKKNSKVFNNRGGVWEGGCATFPARKKNPKYTKKENNLTADHELFPKQLNNWLPNDVTVNKLYVVSTFCVKCPLTKVRNDSKKANTEEQVHNNILQPLYVRFLKWNSVSAYHTRQCFFPDAAPLHLFWEIVSGVQGQSPSRGQP